MLPRKLHQFWDTGAPPAAVLALMDTWRLSNPTWDYQVWCDQSTLALIDSRFDARVRTAYNACAIPAMRADIARYLILYAYGGMYADADLSCLMPLDQVVEPIASALVFRGWKDNVWRTDFMGACAGHALMADIVDTTVTNVHGRISNNLWLVTGPGATSPIVERHVGASDSAIQTFGFFDVRGKILTFHHELDYRSEGRHWAEEQKRSSIYRDDLA